MSTVEYLDDDPAVPVREVDGEQCITRAGIAHLAGWKPGHSVTVRAQSDQDFPQPINGPVARGRTAWYPLAGETGVDAYLAILATRASAKKPPAVAPGDPDELLNDTEAAEALHIVPATLRSYVRYSVPYWQGKPGRSLLPEPDGIKDGKRAWSRGLLTTHQAGRPGPGAGAGRPRNDAAAV